MNIFTFVVNIFYFAIDTARVSYFLSMQAQTQTTSLVSSQLSFSFLFYFLFFLTAMSVTHMELFTDAVQTQFHVDMVRWLEQPLGDQARKVYLTKPRNICAWVRLMRTVIWRIFLLLLLLNFLRLYSQSGRDVSLSILYSFFILVLGVCYLYPYFNLVYY